jgi:type I protein arginine methyltransferase
MQFSRVPGNPPALPRRTGENVSHHNTASQNTDRPTILPFTRPTDEHVPEEQVLGQYIPLQYHYNMLQDEDRVGAFRSAIEACIRPGMHVVELGGGTGILSSFAARMGATVSCVERNQELANCARRFIRENGLDGQVNVIHADATKFIPSSPVDAVVCEMLHVALLREKQTEVIHAFKQNYVKAFGPKLPQFLPETSILMCQPVQQSFEFAGYYAAVPLFQAPIIDQPRTIELAALNPYATVCYESAIPHRFDTTQSIVANRSGTLNAIRFVTQNVIAIDLPNQKAITWPNQCLVLPIDSPIEISEGETIDIAFSYPAGGTLHQLSDSMTVAAATTSSQRQSKTAA